MPFALNGGPNYSNRTVDSTAPGSRFIPEIWSSKLVTKFYEATVLSAISNTDYEGEITSHGDKVVIRTTPDISIYDYEKGKSLTYDDPTSESVELLIDKGKYFNFKVDSVDKHQSDLNLLDNWSTDASEQMKIAIDRDVLGGVYGSVAAENTGATAGKISGDIDLGAAGAPLSMTKANILDYIVDCGTVLDEQDVPEEGRYLILPAWACGLIKKSELKDASIAGDGESIMRNGRLGMIDRFTLYRSNLLAHTTEAGGEAFHMLAGHKSGLTFASQMTEMEELPNPTAFGRLVRGLQVYGYEAIKGESLVHLYGLKG
ncbi:hypothetical protein A3765_28490 [Oleiphilus sp. HI0130]|nr:hypothetical protein A3765_28795 [Oleiphilus sp. HI0130]KZZ72491.1 hypothetical protein A3765_28490 [Oleiphilus sp. HI0130]